MKLYSIWSRAAGLSAGTGMEHVLAALVVYALRCTRKTGQAERVIRALPGPDAASVPIIALTANAFDSDVQNTLASGMNAHLAKPTDSDILYGTLKRFIATALNTEREEKG